MTTPPSTATGDAVPASDSGEPHVGDAASQKPMSVARGLLKTGRPKQWVKNVLVFAAPASAGQLTHGDVILQTLLAFALFTLASIGTYFVNDASDYEADRRHPKKRLRPIAAGVIALPLAWTIAFASIAGALALALALSGPALAGLLFGYVVLTCSYSFVLKHHAVIDLACVAAGFVLRMIAGGIATDTPLSNWFLTVASFSSLLVVAGKRYAEMLEMGEGKTASRAVLAQYTLNFLRTTVGVALAVSVAAYCQWAFAREQTSGYLFYQLSAIPWVVSLLRYALLLEKGEGGAPEELLAADRTLQVLGLIWLTLFGLAIYVPHL